MNKLLTENFPDIINVTFTAKIEEEFDEVAERKRKLETNDSRILWTI